jgi:hypothetical protein
MNTAEGDNTSLAQTQPAHVVEVVRSAQQELAGLLRRKAEIVRRIGTVKQTLAGMANLFGNSILNRELLLVLDRATPSRRKGLTRACRRVLMESRTPLRARQASDQLQQLFPELAGHHKDLTASVTTVFHRLTAYGEARSFLDDQGVRVWEWATDRAASMPGMVLAVQQAREEQLQS